MADFDLEAYQRRLAEEREKVQRALRLGYKGEPVLDETLQIPVAYVPYQGLSWPSLRRTGWWGEAPGRLTARLWRRFFCPRGWHLWDEVSSLRSHYLVCDGCGLMIHIAWIDFRYCPFEPYPPFPLTEEEAVERRASHLRAEEGRPFWLP